MKGIIRERINSIEILDVSIELLMALFIKIKSLYSEMNTGFFNWGRF